MTTERAAGRHKRSVAQPMFKATTERAAGPDAKAVLGYLWTATGINPDIRVCDLFRLDDPLVGDVESALLAAPVAVDEPKASDERVADLMRFVTRYRKEKNPGRVLALYGDVERLFRGALDEIERLRAVQRAARLPEPVPPEEKR